MSLGVDLRLVAVLGLAAAVRLAFVLGAQWDDPPVGDAIYYSAQADTISKGGWFEHPFTGEPAADHPPITSLAFAPASWAPGDDVRNQRVLGALLGVGAVAALMALGRAVGGSTVGLVTGVLAAVYPGLWINDGLIMSETPTALICALLLRSVVRWQAGLTRAWVVGALGGVAILTRAELAVLLVLACVPVIAGRGRARWRELLIIGAVTALVLLPWTARNLVRFERPVLVSTNDGLTLVGANCDSSYGPGLGFWDLRCAGPATGDQSEVSAHYRGQAFSYVGDNLDRVPTVVAARVARVWSVWRPFDQVYLNQGEDREPWASRLALWSFWGLAPAGVAGLVVLRRSGGAWWPLAATLPTVTLTAAAFYGIVRFRLPAEVALVTGAAVLLSHVVPAVTRWNAGRSPAAG